MLVSVGDMRRYMGGLDLSDAQRETMKMIIAGVQESLEAFLNRPVEPVQVRELCEANYNGEAILSVTPVHNILSVQHVANGSNLISHVTYPSPMERDVTLETDDRTLDKLPGAMTNYQIVPGGLKIGFKRTVIVDYIGGYRGSTENAIKLAIMRVVAREWATNHVNTAGLRQGVTEQTEVGDSRFLGWATDELNALSRYRRRVVIR